ncbi:hypothetical protein OUZ56_005190 [Daphnia magna]|uniref:Uncharacterized protein n=1 Tax=Daphnia magna TaxID=35525 RepID=A0ABQ9YS24_9CRUS|nr:hypothetical protein OUZ56_005190 [Daphnia magna]
MVATCRNFELARDELVVQLLVDSENQKGTKMKKKGAVLINKEDEDEEKWFPFGSSPFYNNATRIVRFSETPELNSAILPHHGTVAF